MGNIFNEDFRDFLSALNKHEVRYISRRFFGYTSWILTHNGMDIWVERSSANYKKIKQAFHEFGMPVFDMTENNFLSHPNWDVFTFGNPPVAIDIMVKVKGLDFSKSYDQSIIFEDEGLKIRTIHKNDLIQAKKNAGRSKDLNDIENLQ